MPSVGEFELAGMLRRIRRRADLSQRELAQRCAVSQSLVAKVETGERDLPVRTLVAAARLAGLRLALLDDGGDEVLGMAVGAVRDTARRRVPAHLDTRFGDEDWWHGNERYSRSQPWYTFDRVRPVRDYWRRRRGLADDHQLPHADDSPAVRKARRAEAARRRREEDYRQRVALGLTQPPVEFDCTCPPLCDELDDYSGRPVHTEDCTCGCDVD
jgi:HTH-type transcriptional regulator/antitoxin HipB